jgi:hypothetical protein
MNNSLFTQNLPVRGYHVPDGEILLDNERGFSFVCGCGKTHFTKDAYSVREHKEEGTAIYACPHNDRLLNLVEPVGFFRVKGIKTIASYFSELENDVYSKIFVFREMMENGVTSLKEYYEK